MNDVQKQQTQLVYGNFDITFGTNFAQALSHPHTHRVMCSTRSHAYWMLIGACNPMVCYARFLLLDLIPVVRESNGVFLSKFALLYGNLDIVLDHFRCIVTLYTTPHALRDALYI